MDTLKTFFLHYFSRFFCVIILWTALFTDIFIIFAFINVFIHLQVKTFF